MHPAIRELTDTETNDVAGGSLLDVKVSLGDGLSDLEIDVITDIVEIVDNDILNDAEILS